MDEHNKHEAIEFNIRISQDIITTPGPNSALRKPLCSGHPGDGHPRRRQSCCKAVREIAHPASLSLYPGRQVLFIYTAR